MRLHRSTASWAAGRHVRAAGLLAGAVCVGCISGCYERVIKAKGFGADQMSVQKPYASDTVLDNALMGPIPDDTSQRRIKGGGW